VLAAGAAYFALVFAAGVALGALRVLLVAPQLGTRAAELLEMPLMLGVALLAARAVVRRFALAPGRPRLGAGLGALALLLAAELALAATLRGQAPAEALLDRDPVAGAAYGLALVVFALLPRLVRVRAP
jgi:hypothetical protein